ncbi:MAG: TetR/AcrR family transcriptional regulator [Oscillospiraceae bacterium]|jgi:AcrR family transcriptional regulator|nr:TetR/AcrR family transcriptional regulator [Oscillospiraceae bacterium]
MNKYELRTKQKKDAIIAASLELFREKGYTNVSINDIAAYSEVSSVSIYNYFGSKDGLVPECVRVLMQGANLAAQELLQSKLGFKEKLLQVVELCANQHQQLLQEFFSAEALRDKVLIELYESSASQIRADILRDFIESGKQEGAVNREISTNIIMKYLESIAIVQTSGQDSDSTEIKALYQLMLYGLIGR